MNFESNRYSLSDFVSGFDKNDLNYRQSHLFIGEENKLSWLKSLSMMVVPFSYHLGCVGVIGSRRMNYSTFFKIMPLFSKTVDTFLKSQRHVNLVKECFYG